MLSPPLVDQTGDQSGPTCLMARAQAFSSVAVIVLVEEETVAPVGVCLKFFTVSETSSTPILVARKNSDHPFCNFSRHSSGGNRLPSIGRFDGEVRPQRITKTQQRMNQKVRGREPDRPSPIRVPSFELRFGLARLVTQSAFAKVERMRLVIFRQTSDTVVGEELCRVPKSRRNPVKLAGICDREHVAGTLLITADGVTGIADKIGSVSDEPFHVGQKIRVRF